MPLAPGLTVSAHLEGCAECREAVTVFEEVGQALLTDLPDLPMEPGALGRAVIAIESDPLFPTDLPPAPAKISGLGLPAALAGVGLGSRRWLAPGMWVARAKAPETDGWRTFLVCLPANGLIPAHCHGGGEIVTLLKGSFRDGGAWLQAGDFAQADTDVEHEIRVSADGPCVCLISTQARIQWRGWAKLLEPILEI